MIHQNSNTMLVARFSDNITADIARNWSAWMLPGLGGSYEDCLQDAMNPEHEGGLGLTESEAVKIVREFPEHTGCYGCVHHIGLSAYLLDAESVEDAVKEVKERAHDGSGYGVRTIGKVTVIATISKDIMKSERDLHILEVEDYENEGSF